MVSPERDRIENVKFCRLCCRSTRHAHFASEEEDVVLALKPPLTLTAAHIHTAAYTHTHTHSRTYLTY